MNMYNRIKIFALLICILLAMGNQKAYAIEIIKAFTTKSVETVGGITPGVENLVFSDNIGKIYFYIEAKLIEPEKHIYVVWSREGVESKKSALTVYDSKTHQDVRAVDELGQELVDSLPSGAEAVVKLTIRSSVRYRTYSSKNIIPKVHVGRWQVSIYEADTIEPLKVYKFEIESASL